MVRFAPSFPSTFSARKAAPLLLVVREQLALAEGYGAGIRDPIHDADAPVPVPSRDADAPVPDPFTDAEALEELEEQITTLAAHIHAATHRLLILIADFDRRRGWELGGHRSCAHWLSYRTGIDLGAAREKVRTARVLVGLPETSASMSRGELSFSKVRALTRVATESNEGELLEFAQGSTTAQLERMVRGVRGGDRQDEAALERERWERRTLSVFPGDDGMYVVKGRVPAELGVLLMRAVEAASDALYREKRGPVELGGDTHRAAAQRRADALGLMAERALEVGFGGGVAEEGPAEEGPAEGGMAEGGEDALGDGGACPPPLSGTRAERYQVMLHVDAETLRAEGEGGRSELDDGSRVAAETSRRLSCDCGRVRIDHGPDGGVLDVGRRTRTLPTTLRRALEVRDRGCRFPGCGLRFTEGHHITHWADGGETSMANCVLLCRHHHRLVHEGGWRMDWWGEGRPVFFDPRGGPHFDGRWQDPRKGEPARGPGSSWPDHEPDRVAALMEENRRRGVEPDGWTASARWKREADIPDPVFFRALEALE